MTKYYYCRGLKSLFYIDYRTYSVFSKDSRGNKRTLGVFIKKEYAEDFCNFIAVKRSVRYGVKKNKPAKGKRK
jgi:hypothetical protein